MFTLRTHVRKAYIPVCRAPRWRSHASVPGTRGRRLRLEDLVRELWKRLGVTVLFVTHDIDEVVYLGERVLVLSNSPTVVQDDITVDLPAERDQLTTRQDERFTRLRAHVYAQIQQAKKGTTAPAA